MALGKRCHADIEVAEIAHDPNQFLGIGDTGRMLVPVAEGVARRISAQDEDVADAAVGVGTDERAQFGHAVPDRGQMRYRQQGGLLQAGR